MVESIGPAEPALSRALGELSEAGRAQALRRWQVLRPQLEEDVTLPAAATAAGVALRTAQRWLSRFRAQGLAGLARSPRTDRCGHRLPPDLQLLIEGLALRRPAPSAAHIHRQVAELAPGHGWAVPSYATVYAVVREIDPAMRPWPWKAPSGTSRCTT